jgi:hypothetical protein
MTDETVTETKTLPLSEQVAAIIKDYIPEEQAASDLEAIRQGVVALETDIATLRAEMAERINDQAEAEVELAELKKLYGLEEKDADIYAKRMHAAQNVAAFLYNTAKIRDPNFGTHLTEEDRGFIETVVGASLTKGELPLTPPPKPAPTFIQPTSSPIVPLS